MRNNKAQSKRHKAKEFVEHFSLFPFVFSLCSALAAGAAVAQQYPVKPIRLIVPFAPGGPTDIMSRAISERITSRLGQQLVIDNRPGAGGNIGTEIAAHSAPDGYTMALGHIGTHAINISLYSRTGYDPV